MSPDSVALALVVSVCAAGSQDVDCLEMGKVALKTFDTREAIVQLSEAIRKDPKNAEAFYYRGQAFHLATQFREAVIDFSSAVRLNPTYAEAFFERGGIYHVLGERRLAIADLSEAIRLNPKDVQAHNGRAWVLYEGQEYAKALADFRESLRLSAKNPATNFHLATMLSVCPDPTFRDGRTAVEHATEACKATDWKDWQSLEALAVANAELGKFDEAIKWQRKAIKVLGDVPGTDRAERRLKRYEKHEPTRSRSLLDW